MLGWPYNNRQFKIIAPVKEETFPRDRILPSNSKWILLNRIRREVHLEFYRGRDQTLIKMGTFTFDFCGSCFTRKNNLYRHRKRLHKDEIEKGISLFSYNFLTKYFLKLLISSIQTQREFLWFNLYLLCCAKNENYRKLDHSLCKHIPCTSPL